MKLLGIWTLSLFRVKRKVAGLLRFSPTLGVVVAMLRRMMLLELGHFLVALVQRQVNVTYSNTLPHCPMPRYCLLAQSYPFGKNNIGTLTCFLFGDCAVKPSIVVDVISALRAGGKHAWAECKFVTGTSRLYWYARWRERRGDRVVKRSLYICPADLP